MPYPQAIQEIVDLLRALDDRTERIQVLVSLAERFRDVSPETAIRPFEESRRVPGCESDAFVWVKAVGDNMFVEFAVENPQGVSAKALATVLKLGLDGQPIEAADQLDDELVFTLFGSGLSMGKNLGLTNMVRAVRHQAVSLHRQSPRP